MVGLRGKKVKVKQKTTIHKKGIYSIAKIMISGKDIVGTCTLVQNDLKYIFYQGNGDKNSVPYGKCS